MIIFRNLLVIYLFVEINSKLLLIKIFEYYEITTELPSMYLIV